MSLEDVIKENTAQVKRLADLMEGGAAAPQAAASSGTTAARGPGRPKNPTTAAKPASKFTAAQVQAAITEVKDAKGTDVAKGIIEGAIGAGGKLAALVQKPEVFDAVMAACGEAMEDSGDEPDGDDEI